MFSLEVLVDLVMSEFDEKDTRIFLKGHKANALSKHEVIDLKKTLGADFKPHLKAGDEVTADLLKAL